MNARGACADADLQFWFESPEHRINIVSMFDGG